MVPVFSFDKNVIWYKEKFSIDSISYHICCDDCEFSFSVPHPFKKDINDTLKDFIENLIFKYYVNDLSIEYYEDVFRFKSFNVPFYGILELEDTNNMTHTFIIKDCYTPDVYNSCLEILRKSLDSSLEFAEIRFLPKFFSEIS